MRRDNGKTTVDQLFNGMKLLSVCQLVTEVHYIVYITTLLSY